MSYLRELWRFARPHTIIGTSLSLVCLWLMARGMFRPPVSGALGDELGDFELGWQELILTWLACIAANVYIVGLNQVTDIELDRINKPYLPLASGVWSRKTGERVVWFCLGLSALLTLLIDSDWLYWTVGLSLMLGTVYSLPPLRLKRFNFWAAFCIIAVRSLIVNILLFAHVAQWRGPILDLPPLVWLLVAVMFAYSVAIAWFKDLPDDKGDAAYGVETLTVQHGKRWVLQRGTLLLGSTLVATILVAWLSGRFGSATSYLGVSHAILLAVFLWNVKRVELSEPLSVRRFYLWLWGLFFIEYMVFAGAGYV